MFRKEAHNGVSPIVNVIQLRKEYGIRNSPPFVRNTATIYQVEVKPNVVSWRAVSFNELCFAIALLGEL